MLFWKYEVLTLYLFILYQLFPGDFYVEEVSSAIETISKSGGKLAGFMCEPLAISCGIIVPSKTYYKRVYE